MVAQHDCYSKKICDMASNKAKAKEEELTGSEIWPKRADKIGLLLLVLHDNNNDNERKNIK